MFRYFGKLYDDAKIYTYNYIHQEQPPKTYQTLQSEDDDKIESIHNANIDDKQLRIDILLFVRQFKNTYYKYTNKDKFNPELYNSFVDDKHFDGGLTAFDDDDNIRIFDKYILEYIKNRNDIMTYLQCKNKIVELQTKLENLREIADHKEENINVLFTIDMNEKDLFNYCYSIIQKAGNIAMIKNIVFSIIIKYNGEHIRMKLGTFNKNKNNHPYLILERFIS
jgi:hypothetical protein